MPCPYPGCNGEIKSGFVSLYCENCAQPAVLCPECQTGNRSLARHCRSCGKEIRAIHNLTALDIFSRPPKPRKTQPVKVGTVHNVFPELKPYGGYLWAVNYDGEIYRLCTEKPHLEKCAELPGDGFSFPWIVEEDDSRGPLIYANNERSIYEFEVLTGRYRELFDMTASNPNDSLCSGILKADGCFYFLIRRRSEKESLLLKCIGNSQWEYELGDASLSGSDYQPIRKIQDSLWVLTRERLMIFPQSADGPPKEISWDPWHVLPTEKGIWYSRRFQSDDGRKHALSKVTFERDRIVESVLLDDLPLTTNFAVSPQDGRIAIFWPGSVKVYEFNKSLYNEVTGILDIRNTLGVLLDPPFLFWHEAEDRSVYQWNIDARDVGALVSSWEGESFSQFFLAYGYLFGLAKGEIWRWDLSGT